MRVALKTFLVPPRNSWCCGGLLFAACICWSSLSLLADWQLPAVRASSSASSFGLDWMTHNITVLTSLNFNVKVRQFRDRQISVVLFYTKTDVCQKLIDGEYNILAESLKGMVLVGAVDCDEFPLLCSDYNVVKYPTILIFPVNPFPPQEVQGEVEAATLRAQLVPLIPSHAQILGPDKIDMFLAQPITLPKVLLFSDKSVPPPLFKALSNSFKDNIKFGFIDITNATNQPLVDRWKIKSTPHLILLKSDSKAPPQVYKGKHTFQALHDWLNVFSETFGLGGGFSDKGATAAALAKTWLSERVPELTKESHVDICFNKSDKSRGLCVIYLKHGGPLSSQETSMIEELTEQFTSHLADRGATFRWMWMDMKVEENFEGLFELSQDQLPSVVVFNPHKRLRFTTLAEGMPATTENIKSLLDKIAGGDARFKNVKGQVLPPFAERKAAAESKAKDEL